MMSSFQSFNLTEQDSLNGQIFSNIQLQVLQNELSAIAERILTLTYDPLNPVDFAQQHAHANGQLQLLQFLMARSDESKQILMATARESTQS